MIRGANMQFYSFREIFILVLINLAIHRSKACSEIEQLINSLPFVSLSDTKCIIGNNCSSMQCISTAEEVKFSVGFVLTCGNDPAIEINANIPSSGIIGWHATFKDQTEKVIPGYFFPASQNKALRRQGSLKVSLKKFSDAESVILLGLTLKGCEPTQENQGVDYFCTEKRIITNQQLLCGKGKPNNQNTQQRFCSLFRPSECDLKETCSQTGQSDQGECQCFKGYTRDEYGTCSIIAPEPLQLPTAVPGSLKSNETGVSESTKDPAALAVNIVVPILILTLVAALLYPAFKHGCFHKVLVSLCRRRTETVLIMDDDDSPLV